MYRVYRFVDGVWLPDHIECSMSYLPGGCKIDIWDGKEWKPYKEERGEWVG